jgi:aryl-alcohol dehydrogenase-like predicted oxidoreductase
MAQAIQSHDLDCVQIALNPSRNGRFEELALPAARGKNLGIIAMKVTGQEFLLGKEPGKTDMHSLLRYSLSLPVTTTVVGMPRLEFVQHNTELARNFSPLAENEMEQLRRALERSREPLEKRLVGHLDGPSESPAAFWV